jgi:excisionase family DNA binding protein
MREDIQVEGLSMEEACFVAGFGRTSLYEAIASGKLIARKMGKRRIILRSDLMKFLSDLPIEQDRKDQGKIRIEEIKNAMAAGEDIRIVDE